MELIMDMAVQVDLVVEVIAYLSTELQPFIVMLVFPKMDNLENAHVNNMGQHIDGSELEVGD